MAPAIRHILKSDLFRYIAVYFAFCLTFYAFTGSFFIAVMATLFLFGPFIGAWFAMQFFENRTMRYFIFALTFTALFTLFFAYMAHSVDMTQNIGYVLIYSDGNITLAGLAYNIGASLALCFGLLVANTAIKLMSQRI